MLKTLPSNTESFASCCIFYFSSSAEPFTLMSRRFVKISKGLLLLPASAVVVFCISQYYKVQTADSAAFMEEKLFGNQRNSFTPYSASTGKSMKEDSYAEMLDKLNREKIVQEDPRLIKLIQDHFVEPPSTRPYNLKNPKKKSLHQ